MGGITYGMKEAVACWMVNKDAIETVYACRIPGLPPSRSLIMPMSHAANIVASSFI